ncbi:MAG TPA: response regulator transcription factor [Bryobacteraceae bacterium]|nr:response regulator transcription factor [Bryobacteraceae bacterium]
MIRLAIAAGSAVVRAGLEALARSDPEIELAGAYSDLAGVEALRPDVILAAVPFEDLPAAADAIAPPIVFLANANGDHPGWTREAVRAGVRAVLPPDASQGEILAAVAAAANGLAVLDPRDLEGMLASPAVTSFVSPPAEPAVLTPREIEVLRLMAEGEPNKTIAWKLGISEHTAKFHAASILSKLNAASRAEAVAIGIRKGLILL